MFMILSTFGAILAGCSGGEKAEEGADATKTAETAGAAGTEEAK